MSAPAVEPVLPPVRVLVADDSAGVRELVTLLLDLENDFTVVGQARDGLEVVERARVLQPDLVVLDVSMPRLDGIAATSRIRAASSGSRIVLFTGIVEPGLEAEAAAAGVDGLLAKELGAATLVERLREICRRPRLRMPSSA